MYPYSEVSTPYYALPMLDLCFGAQGRGTHLGNDDLLTLFYY